MKPLAIQNWLNQGIFDKNKCFFFLQLIKINDEPMKPLAIQMGNGNSSDGKYSQVARMALSHPVLPIQPPEPKSEEQYGSHSHISETHIISLWQLT